MKLRAAELHRDFVHDLLKAAVAPRPIAWVSTISPDGKANLAPFSCYSFVCIEPPMLAFSIERRPDGSAKHTLLNIEATREFIVNMATEALAEPLNATAADFPRGVSEFDAAGLTPIASEFVSPPRVAESPLSMACRLAAIHPLGNAGQSLVIGQVIGFEFDERCWRDGRINLAAFPPLARLTGDRYGVIGRTFELPRPWLAASSAAKEPTSWT